MTHETSRHCVDTGQFGEVLIFAPFGYDYCNSVALVQFRLNKREANNALDRAVFFNRLGGLSDRTFENQRPSNGSILATGFRLKMT